ncbi:hypothetical protein ACWC5I_11145 [Kitasatospora sp. NPDC001574]
MLKKLVADGWTLRHESHWGKLYCPCENRCTTIPVAGTPQNPSREAKRIRAAAARCPKPADSPQRSLTGMDRGEVDADQAE